MILLNSRVAILLARGSNPRGRKFELLIYCMRPLDGAMAHVNQFYDDIFSVSKLTLLVLSFNLTVLNKQFSSQSKIRLYFKVVTTSTSRSVQEDCRLRKRISFFFPRTLERRAFIENRQDFRRKRQSLPTQRHCLR